MKKKRTASAIADAPEREDFDAMEWGNIELPGLSDEKLYSTNWNLSASMRDWWATATLKQKQARWEKIAKKNRGKSHKWLYVNNPELRERKSKALKEAYRKGTKKHHFKGKNLTKKHKKKISDSHMGKIMTPETKQNISRAKKGMDPVGGNFKPVKTPYGVFSSLREAAEFEQPITGRKYNPNRMTDLIKNPDSGYKKISRQQYEKHCRKNGSTK